MENTLTWNYPINGGPDRTITYKCFFFKHAMFEHRFRPYFRGPVLFRWTSRLSVGIEDAQDLILDLEQAIKALGCAGCEVIRKSPGSLESASLWQLSVIKKGKGLEFPYLRITWYRFDLYHSYRVGKGNRPDTSRDQVAAGELSSTPHGGFDSEFQVRVPMPSCDLHYHLVIKHRNPIQIELWTRNHLLNVYK